MKQRTYLFAGLFLLLPTMAFASGDGHSPNWTNLLYRTINFIIVAGILYYVLNKKFIAFFSGRTSSIETELKNLDDKRQEAEENLKAVEKSIANLEAEKSKILEDARTQGNRLKDEILAEAAKTAARIQEQAKMTAEQEVRQTLATIRGQIAEQIINEAQALIDKQLTTQVQEKLIQDSLQKVVLH